MLTLEQNCEVFVLRNDIPVQEWLQCTQGKNLAVKKSVFSASIVTKNLYCGDISRVMASFSSNSQAINSFKFGEFAALCGEGELLQMYLMLQLQREHVYTPDILFICIKGSIVSGNAECLETCIQTWVDVFRMDYFSIQSSESLMMMLLRHFLEQQNLYTIHKSTFEWISSRWTNNKILTYIEDLPLQKLDLPYMVAMWTRCGHTHLSNATLLMSSFSCENSLSGVRWLDGMGVQSTRALINAIWSGHRDVLEYL